MSDVTMRFKGDASSAVRAARDLDEALDRVDRSARDASGGMRKAGDETDRAGKALRDVDDDTKRASAGFGKLVTSMVAVAAGTAAMYGLAKGARFAVDAASDLTEQINKTKVVFGEGSKAVLEFSETTATSLGISQRAALEAAGTFGNMLVPMGFAREEAGKMSVRMVALAADMASFNNASPERTLEALRAGLAGETEPLRQFGVFLNEARIKQEALNLGLYNGKGQLDASAKAAATYSIILKDTKDAQGDFANTSGSLANQQRILRAEIEELAASIGVKFLPIITSGMQQLTKALADPQVKQKIEEIAEAISETLANAVDEVVDFVRNNWPEIKEIFGATRDTAKQLAAVIREVVVALDKVAKAVGGWDMLFKLVLAGTLVAKFGLLAGSITKVGVAAETAAGAQGVGGLLTKLKMLGALSPILLPITAVITMKVYEDEIVAFINKHPALAFLDNRGNVDPNSLTDAAIAALPDWAQGAAKEAQTKMAAANKSVGTVDLGLPVNLGGAPTPASRGKLQAPSSWAGTHVTDGLGWGTKTAIDIMAAPGTPVGAPEDGTTGAFNPSGAQGGGSLRFYSYSGWEYWLGHVDQGQPGKKVLRGDTICVVSGDHPRPHLHLDKTRMLAGQPIDAGGASGGTGADTHDHTTGSGGGAAPSTTSSSAPKAPSAAPDDQVAAATRDLAAMAKGIDDAVAATVPKLRASLDKIRDLWADAKKDGIVTPAELAAIKRAQKELSDVLGNAIDVEEIRKQIAPAKAKLNELFKGGFIDEATYEAAKANVAKTAALIRQAGKDGVITDAELKKIEASMDAAADVIKKGTEDQVAAAIGVKRVKEEFGKIWKDGLITDAEIEKIKAGLSGLKGVVVEGIVKAADAVSETRAKFQTAWAEFTAQALAAFDKAHQQMREALKVTLTFNGLEVTMGMADLTPAEAELKRINDEIAKIERDATEARLQAAVEAATTEEERQKAQTELTRFLLMERAAVERAAADEALKAAQAAFDERTQVDRVNFEKRLAQIGADMGAQKLTYDEGLGQITALFDEYKVPFGEKSGALGLALQTALITAFGAVETAMGRLATAIEALVRKMGGQVNEAKRLAALGAAEYNRLATMAQQQYIDPATGQFYAPGQGPGTTLPPPTAPEPTGDQANNYGYGNIPDYTPGAPRLYANGGIAGWVAGFAGGGGYVPGTYTPSDSLIARLSPGELVLNPRQQAQLFAVANGRLPVGRGAPPVVHNHFTFPQYVGTVRDLVDVMRREIDRVVASSGPLGW